MQKYKKYIFILALLISVLPAFSQDTVVTPADRNLELYQPVDFDTSGPKRATLTHNDIHNQYSFALDRFVQSNVKYAYRDFAVLIETMKPTDYGYMQIANRMSELGLFNLADSAVSKISDKDISSIIVEDMKRFYYPVKKLKPADEMYLAEVFSNIVYNDQSLEATTELVKNTDLLTHSDYANYVAALGYLRAGDLISAGKYIDYAISLNSENLNYKKLKAEILVSGNKPKDALKIAQYIKQQRLYSTDFANKGGSLEQFLLYKSQKNENKKLYHLGYYYYLEGDLNKSVRTLQGAVSSKKSLNRDVYALLARVYFDNNDFEKAKDTAAKALKAGSKNYQAYLVLGDCAYRNNDYKEALKYFKTAESISQNISLPLVRLAQTYEKLNKEKKAYEIYEKILKTYSDAYMAYYKIALKDKSKEIAYLKKSLAINIRFKDAWIDLGRVESERHNYEEAKKYLAVANYIDENDFRYYYYQGLIYKNQGLKENAERFFKKSLLLNPDYQPAKEELSI